MTLPRARIFMMQSVAMVATLATNMFIITGTVAGQTVRSGSIAGTVFDETGAALPGMTVTLTSPALQTPQLLQTSDGRGAYQFVDLPPGAYRIVF